MHSVVPSSLATQFRVDPARFCNKSSQARSQWYIYISTIGFRAFVWLFVNWRESSWPIGPKSLGPNRHSTRKDNQQSNKWKLKTFSKFKFSLPIVIDYKKKYIVKKLNLAKTEWDKRISLKLRTFRRFRNDFNSLFFIYKFGLSVCLSVCLFVCLFVSNKRLNRSGPNFLWDI